MIDGMLQLGWMARNLAGLLARSMYLDSELSSYLRSEKRVNSGVSIIKE